MNKGKQSLNRWYYYFALNLDALFQDVLILGTLGLSTLGLSTLGLSTLGLSTLGLSTLGVVFFMTTPELISREIKNQTAPFVQNQFVQNQLGIDQNAILNSSFYTRLTTSMEPSSSSKKEVKDSTDRRSNKRDSNPQLRQQLSNFGWHPQDLGRGIYSIYLEQNSPNLRIEIRERGQKKYLLDCPLSFIEDTAKVPPAIWQKIQSVNQQIAPAYFSYNQIDKRLHLYSLFTIPIPKNANPSVFLKQAIMQFGKIAVDHHTIWRAIRQKTDTEELLSEPVLWVEHLSKPREIVLEKQPNQKEPSFESLFDLGNNPLPHLKKIELEIAPSPRIIQDKGNAQIVKLRGRWKLTSTEQHGEQMFHSSYQLLHGPSLTFQNNTCFWEYPLQPKKQFTFRLDPKAPEKNIDFIDSDKRAQKGIYKLEKNRLTICLSPVGKPRPQSFESNRKTSIIIEYFTLVE